MRICLRSLTAILAVLCVVAVASAEDKVQLKYTPPAGQAEVKLLDAQLASIELGGTPLGVTATASGKLNLKVDSIDEKAATFNLVASVEDVTAEFNGQDQTVPKSDPFTLTVTQLGDITKLKGTGADIDLFGAGGLPLQLIGDFAGVVRLPDGPVAIGEKWQSDTEQEFPQVGKIIIHSESELASMKDGVATINSTVSTTLPAFQAPNPMQPGAKVNVQQAKISIEGLVRQFDTKTSSIRKAEGKLVIDANVDVQGFAAPVKATADFHIVDSRFAPKTGAAAKPAEPANNPG
jgi:hypothetical protein